MLTYGPALPQDVECIYGMLAELIDRYEDFSGMDREKVLAWSRRSIGSHLPDYFRIYADGELAGFCALHEAEGKWEADNLFLLPPFRGQGIGTAVLKRCMAQAETGLFLYTFRENTGAVRLYERLGFRVAQEVGNTRYIMEYEKEGC